MSTSAAAVAETVRLYCQACRARFSLPAPASPFDFTLCPHCRQGYLDDRLAPFPLPLRPPPPPLWPSSPPCPPLPSTALPPSRQPLPPWIPSSSSSSSATTLPLPPPPPSPLWPSSPPSPSSTPAMLPPPPRPLLWISSSSSSSSSATRLSLPPPPPPCVPSLAPSSSSTTLPWTPPFPCARASPSSKRLPSLPPPTTSSGTTTSSAAPLPYYCPKHLADAMRKGPPFPLFTLQRCPNCRVHGFHEDAEHSLSSSTTASHISSAYSLDSSSRLWPPPPPALYRGKLQPGLPTLTMERADFVGANDEPQPAPIAWITRLPVITVSDSKILCALCFNPISRRRRRLPCGHQYHFGCIMPWLLRHYSCPVRDCNCNLHALPPPPPLPPPRPPPTLSRTDTLDDFFSPSPSPPPSLMSVAYEIREHVQSAPRTPPPPPPQVSIYASLIDSPVYHGGSQAAPAASITALPTVTISDTAEICAVCMEPLPLAVAARRLPCGHLYHSDCIVPWLSRNNSCPVCRRDIPMFPSPTAETAPSLSPSRSLPQPTPGRRLCLPGASQIRRIFHRLLRYMATSRARSSNRSGNVVHG